MLSPTTCVVAGEKRARMGSSSRARKFCVSEVYISIHEEESSAVCFQDLTLHFVVLSFDRYSRDDVIGEVMVELNNIDFGSSVDNARAPVSISKEIMPRSFKVCTLPMGARKTHRSRSSSPSPPLKCRSTKLTLIHRKN